jgi:hypothetical protein
MSDAIGVVLTSVVTSLATLAIAEFFRRWKQSDDDERNVNLALVELLDIRNAMGALREGLDFAVQMGAESGSMSGVLAGMALVIDPKSIPAKYNRAIDLLAPTQPLLANYLRGLDRVIILMDMQLQPPPDVEITAEDRKGMSTVQARMLRSFLPDAIAKLDLGIRAAMDTRGRRLRKQYKRLVKVTGNGANSTDVNEAIRKHVVGAFDGFASFETPPLREGTVENRPPVKPSAEESGQETSQPAPRN